VPCDNDSLMRLKLEALCFVGKIFLKALCATLTSLGKFFGDVKK
jgi:hypothetical protein